MVLPSDKDETKVRVPPRPMPNYQKSDAVIKLNAAALRREEATRKQKESEQAAKLRDFMINMRDESEFEQWKADMSKRDEIQRMEQIQMRKIEMELTREEAMEAMRMKARENHLVAAKLKEESKEQLEDKGKQLQVELEERKKAVTTIVESRANITAEKEKVVERNKQIKEELQREIQEAIARRKEEDVIEKAKRDELIRQIREIERQPMSRTKGYDPTEVMGYGLLEEMSLAQLKERLDQRKQEMEDDIKRRREENVAMKEKKAAELQDIAGRLAAHREREATTNEQRRQKKREMEEEKKRQEMEIRDKGRLEVYEKIKGKKRKKLEEQRKLEKELKEIQLKRQYMNANRALVEEKAWKEQEKGLEREARERQDNQLMEQERIERIKLAETQLRAKAAQTLVQTKTAVLDEFALRDQTAHEENELLQRMDRQEKLSKHAKQKEYEEAHTQHMEERNTYATKINTASLTSAKAAQSE